jgi:hypothetical protein
MLRFLTGLLVLALAVPTWAQRIETETPNRDRIVEVHTALNHLTVIEVGEPVVTVVAGSSAFKVEWRDNKVFVEPKEPNVSTNLFIWTGSSRLNYELEPAGPVGSMDFAIDHPKPPVVAKVVKQPSGDHTSKRTQDDPPRPLPVIQSMLRGQPIHDEQLKPAEHRVNVFLKDLFEQNGTIYIRYEIRNQTGKAYEPGTPKVYLLNGVRSSQSLVGRENTQLCAEEVRKLRFQGYAPVRVMDAEMRSVKLSPDQETVGVVGVKVPRPSAMPQVLSIQFSFDGRGVVGATLVL